MNETNLASFATYIQEDSGAIRLRMTLLWSNVWSGRVGAVRYQNIECYLKLFVLLKYELITT